MPVRPSILNHLFARGFAIAGVAGALALAVAVACMAESRSLWAVIAVIAALPLGGLLGLLFLWPLLFRIGGWVNGAPFQEGDTVRVLVGRHRGRVGPVYEVWASRGQVRVQLDPQAAQNVTDVFSDNQLLRQ